MTFLRLVVAACLLPAVKASSSLRRALQNDPARSSIISITISTSTAAYEEAASAAIADARALYETLKEDYVREGCSEVWGEFPSETSKRTNPSMESSLSVTTDTTVKTDMTMICNCGVIYDLAAAAMMFPEEDLAAGASLEDETTRINASRSQTTTMTKLDSWIMARTPNLKSACIGRSASGYSCANVDMIAHLPLNSFVTTNTGKAPKEANDVWGWTSSDGREFVIWGVYEGHFFFELIDTNDNGSVVPLLLLGFLPSTMKTGTMQHDMKVVGNFAYMGAEQEDHGMQIFDMRRLLTVDPKNDCVSQKYCQKLDWDRLYTGTTKYRVGNSHNIVVNEERNFVYIVGGTNGCYGGLHIVDVSNPLNPSFVACFGNNGYVHDAHCVNYKGPDQTFKDREICFCFHGNHVTIIDVTNKSSINILSKTNYNKASYTHQGWLSSDHSHVVFGDESDERIKGVKQTRTLVLNVENLRNPTNFREYSGATGAIDHNQYVVRATAEGQNYDPSKYQNTDLIYQANYAAGLSIMQVIDYEEADFKEVGFFDTFSLTNDARFSGAWSVFPYFRSGVVVISSIEEGLFLVKPNLENFLVAPTTPSPTPGPPTPPPTPPPSENCSDTTLRYKGKGRKNCEWVGTAEPVTRRGIKRRCRKMWKERRISYYCRDTCGKVGLGACRSKFSSAASKTETKNENETETERIIQT
jgi:choice-of-anchor B domain-containing protein